MIGEAGGVGRIRATIIESEKGAEQFREVGEPIDTTIIVELPVLHETSTASDEERRRVDSRWYRTCSDRDRVRRCLDRAGGLDLACG